MSDPDSAKTITEILANYGHIILSALFTTMGAIMMYFKTKLGIIDVRLAEVEKTAVSEADHKHDIERIERRIDDRFDKFSTKIDRIYNIIIQMEKRS